MAKQNANEKKNHGNSNANSKSNSSSNATSSTENAQPKVKGTSSAVFDVGNFNGASNAHENVVWATVTSDKAQHMMSVAHLQQTLWSQSRQSSSNCLMQLMPTTAQLVARKLGKHS